MEVQKRACPLRKPRRRPAPHPWGHDVTVGGGGRCAAGGRAPLRRKDPRAGSGVCSALYRAVGGTQPLSRVTPARAWLAVWSPTAVPPVLGSLSRQGKAAALSLGRPCPESPSGSLSFLLPKAPVLLCPAACLAGGGWKWAPDGSSLFLRCFGGGVCPIRRPARPRWAVEWAGVSGQLHVVAAPAWGAAIFSLYFRTRLRALEGPRDGGGCDSAQPAGVRGQERVRPPLAPQHPSRAFLPRGRGEEGRGRALEQSWAPSSPSPHPGS